MRPRVEILDSIMPAAPLPHHHLRFEGYTPMGPAVPGAGGGSHSPRQGFAHPGRREWPRSRGFSRIHPVVYERGEGEFVGVWPRVSIADTFVVDVTEIYDLFDYRHGCGLPLADPGSYGPAAEFEPSVIIGMPCQGG